MVVKIESDNLKNVLLKQTHFTRFIGNIAESGIKVATFIDPDERQVEASLNAGASAVELHVGNYCASLEREGASQTEFQRIVSASTYATNCGLECHAGHGLTYDSAALIATIRQITELNIGHFLIGESVFAGLRDVVRKMRKVIDTARSGQGTDI